MNYAQDHAVEFDFQGKPVMTEVHAYRPGKASLSFRRRPVSDKEMAAHFSENLKENSFRFSKSWNAELKDIHKTDVRLPNLLSS